MDPEHGGQRLDVFLAGRFGRSRTAIRAGLRGGVRTGDGRPLKWSHRVQSGETLLVPSLVRPEPQVAVVASLIHRDADMVAVDKGPGAPVHPSRSWRTRTILTRLREELADPELRPAHRLDRETSGVLVFGRSRVAVSSLMRQFQAGRVSKRYLAVVRGVPGFDRRVVDAPLALDPGFPIRCRMRVVARGGQAAVTEIATLKTYGDRALVAAMPRTGRQHQIRVHLAHLGHPVLGDKLYQEDGRPYLAMIRDGLSAGDLDRLGHGRQALHAVELTLAHPSTGDPLTLRAPLPPDLGALLQG